MRIEIAGSPDLASLLTDATDPSGRLSALLVAAVTEPAPAAAIEHATAFAASIPPRGEALIIHILFAPTQGLAFVEQHAANAALWAFTQQAALEWAPRRIRVNAIGLGTCPAGPFAPQEQSGHATGPAPAAPATAADIARTIRAMVGWPSMTGQIIRLGV